MARESPTQRPVSHLVSTPWSALQSCFSVPPSWLSHCSFTDIRSGTDDIRCPQTLKPTPCVSLDPFCPVSFTHLSLNLIRLVKFSMQHIRQNAPAMNQIDDSPKAAAEPSSCQGSWHSLNEEEWPKIQILYKESYHQQQDTPAVSAYKKRVHLTQP